ncbi:MAG TPA: mandelate racemase/muconate lactonizing enzyme family protein [Verrucomicrobiae bacterium]|nr:mandelate racemase/muconate lactonizing enzyme family protein [Verrucomicrobiae bacterium]
MKIAKVEAFRIYPKVIKEAWVDDEYVWPSQPPSFVIKVTAENGDYGVGEATSQTWYLGETAAHIEACVGLYDRALRGQDPRNFAQAHRLMEAQVSGGMPGGRGARSGVDMAIYDLAGKSLGVPVHALLGGAYRTEFELLTNLYHKTPEAMAAASDKFVKQGFKGLKIKVGDVVLAKGWNRDNLESELAKLKAALEVVPSNVYIDADANQGWLSAKWTVSVLRRFAGFDNLSIEQPLPYADLEGAAFVRAHAKVPVILDESVWSPEALMQIVRMGACDRMVMKLNRIGGFFPALQAISICESAGIGVSMDTNPYTMLGDTAVCHIAAVAKTPYPVDCEGHVSFLDMGEHNPFRGGITFDGALARLPAAAGLGVDVDWDMLARHQVLHAA